MGYIRFDYDEYYHERRRQKARFAKLEAELERIRFLAWSLGAFVLALILSIAVVK